MVKKNEIIHLKDDKDNMQERSPLANLDTYFWSVKDRYGSPQMGNLVTSTDDAQPLSTQLDSSTPLVWNYTYSN